MVKLTCRDHGFDCDFEVEGVHASEVLAYFERHTSFKHGTKFVTESLMQFIIGSEYSCLFCNSKFDSKEALSKHIDTVHHSSG